MSLVSLVALVASQRSVRAQTQDEATRLLQQYVAIDTSNPPGDTRKAADFLAGVLEREGIPVTRYESAPGKAIVMARLKATVSPPAGKAVVLLHHMDVVPADKAQWKVDPFAATIEGNELWGRGAMVPYAFGSSDGLFNLGSALSFVQVLPPGVYVAMNGRHFPWNRVRKNKEAGIFEEI